jgi:Ca2+/Na+ antiporter
MLLYLLLLILLVALIFFYRRMKVTLSHKDNVIVQLLCVGILLLFYVKLFSLIFAKDEKAELLKKENEYMELAGEYVIGCLKSGYIKSKKKKILIIDYPDNKKLPGHDMSASIIRGIERGLEGSGFEIEAIEKPVFSRDPSRYWLSAQEFDRMIMSHPDAGFVISLVGLPRMLGEVTYWRKKGAPKLLMVRGNISRMELAFKYKAVIGAMVFMPGSSFKFAKKLTEQNKEDQFYEYFIFVTPYNFKDVKMDFPELFVRRK